MRDTLADTPRLTTPRLDLRPLERGDIPAIVEGVGNYDVARWLSTVPYPYAPSDAEDFLAGRVSNDGHHWAIDAGDGLVGVVSITNELGYWLARPAWGGGYGFEAVRAAVANWFSNPANDHLDANYFDGNEKSARLLSCLGFRKTRSEHRWARPLNQEVTSHRMRLTRAAWAEVCRFDVRTKRLRLRELERRDARALAALTTPAIARMVSSIPESFSLAAAKAFITRRRWQGLPGFLVGIETAEGKLIGCVGCGGEPVTAMIFLCEGYWGKGLATEAGRAFVDELFRRFPLSAVHAEHFVDNPASGSVLRKIGFTKVGTHTGTSEARLEPATVVEYRLTRDTHRTST